CDGIVTGAAVVCPLHAWKVNLATGTVERPEGVNACVQTYPIRVEDEVILLGLPRAEMDGGGDGLTAKHSEGAGNHSRETSACSAPPALNPSQRTRPAPRTPEAA